MGEKTYIIISGDEVYKVRFSEDDDDFDCLCTFPHNDQRTLKAERVISLALFGAAVRLACTNEIGTEGGYVYLPDTLPKWIVDDLKKWQERLEVME